MSILLKLLILETGKRHEMLVDQVDPHKLPDSYLYVKDGAVGVIPKRGVIIECKEASLSDIFWNAFNKKKELL